VHVTVADRGHGIPAAQMGRLFDSFFTTKPQGMGLGLSMARSIIQAHQGRIWAESCAGGGAAFHFTLRCCPR
jgi:signal transduction histidine kinase